MITLEAILDMTEKIGIDIENNKSKKHFILDDLGRKIEFNTSMIIQNKKGK